MKTRGEERESEGRLRAIDLRLLEHPSLIKGNDGEVLLPSYFEVAFTAYSGNWLRQSE